MYRPNKRFKYDRGEHVDSSALSIQHHVSNDVQQSVRCDSVPKASLPKSTSRVTEPEEDAILESNFKSFAETSCGNTPRVLVTPASFEILPVNPLSAPPHENGAFDKGPHCAAMDEDGSHEFQEGCRQDFEEDTSSQGYMAKYSLDCDLPRLESSPEPMKHSQIQEDASELIVGTLILILSFDILS
jgi:hypothetical protein